MLLAVKPRVLTRAMVLELIGGNRVVKSMPQVATEFGVSAATIRQSWKANGMPGVNGSYDLAEILLWRWEYERANESKLAPVTGDNLEKSRLENEKLRWQVAKLESQYQEKEGLLVAREEVRAEVYAMLAVFSKHLLEVPRALYPLLPQKIASTIVAEVEKLIRHALGALSEKCYRSYMKEGDAYEREDS